MTLNDLKEQRLRAELCESVQLPGASIRAILDRAIQYGELLDFLLHMFEEIGVEYGNSIRLHRTTVKDIRTALHKERPC